MQAVSIKRKENSEICKGKNIVFSYVDVVAIKERKRKIENPSYLPQKRDGELSKQVNAPAIIIWSDGRIFHISARANAYMHA